MQHDTQLDAVLAVLHLTQARMDEAEAELCRLSLDRLPQLKDSLSAAADGIGELKQALLRCSPETRKTLGRRAEPVRLLRATQRIHALHSAATNFHDLLSRARSVETNGYGGVIASERGVGNAWSASAGQGLRTIG